MNDKMKIHVIKMIVDDKTLSTEDKISVLNDLFTKYEDKIIIKRIYEPYPYEPQPLQPVYPIWYNDNIFSTAFPLDVSSNNGTALQPNLKFTFHTNDGSNYC